MVPGLNPASHPVRHARSAFFTAALIVLLVAARSSGRPLVEDVGLWDEVFYLNGGLALLEGTRPDVYWGPIYSAWYALLGLVQRDALALFRLNWPALLFLNLTAWWAISKALALRPWVVAATLGWLAFARVLDPAWPYVMVFTSGALGVGLALALRRKSLPGALAVATGAVGILAFARPELVVAFALLLAATVVAHARERRPIPTSIRSAALSVLPFLVLLAVLGSPLVPSRSLLAFGQHYALNVREARGGDFDPWHEWKPVMERAFGRVESVPGAALANPGEFAWNLGVNLKAFAATSLAMLAPRPVRPSRAEPDAAEWVASVLAAIALGAGLFFASRDLRRRSPDDPIRRHLVVIGLVAIALLASQVAGVAAVRARPHHLALTTLPLLALASFGLSRRLAFARADRLAPAVAIALVLLVPSRAGEFPWMAPSRRAGPTLDTPEYAVVEQLRALRVPPGRTVTVVELSFAHTRYVQYPSRSINVDSCPRFLDCIGQDPDVVIVDDGLEKLYSDRGDSVFASFLERADRLGYVVKTATPTDTRVFVKAALAPRN